VKPRGLRARLVVTYTLAATGLFGVWAVVAVQALNNNLRSTLDTTLAARATPFLQALNEPESPDLPAAAAEPGTGRVTDGLAVVLAPDGSVRYSDPPTAAGPVRAVLPPAESTSPALLDRNVNGQQLRLRVDTVARRDGVWHVVVGVGLGTTDEASDRIEAVLRVTLPVLLIIIAGGTWLLAGAALRPVERMRAEAAALGAGDAGARLTEPATGDELHALAVTFNDLLDRLHHSLAQQRDFVADAGHELRTPLAIMLAELELADRPHRTPEELREAIATTRSEVERLRELAEDLLLLATEERALPDLTAAVDLREVVAAAVSARQGIAERAGVTLEVRLPLSASAAGDAAALRRAVDNVLSNALDHTPAGGSVSVELRPATAGELCLEVSDTGPGFPPEFLPHAFDRFRRAQTARTSSASTGLGLAIVAAVVRAHGGSVAAANRAPGPGATVSITLPMAPGAARPPSERRTHTPSSHQDNRTL
jgi:heavy metal sensor kinase